jgi:hypothetical protein
MKEELQRKLQAARAAMLSRLEGLDEYGLRRPMTPTPAPRSGHRG